MTFKVKVHEVKKATNAEAKAFRAAARQVEIELNSDEFWYDVAMVYNTWENKKLGDQNFKEFKEMVLGGSTVFDHHEDKILDVLVEFYYSWRSVVGYTTPSTWYTWINRNVFKGFDLGDIGGNIAHEGLHNQGLGHPKANRDSVTYKFGYMVRDRIKKRLGLESTINFKYKRSLWTRVKRFFGRIL